MRIGHITLILGLVVILFYIAGHYAFGKDRSITVIYALVVGCSSTIMLNWFMKGIQHARDGLRSGASNILFSTWLTWTVLFALFLYSIIFVLLDRPLALQTSPIAGLISSLLVVSGIVAVLTPINTEEEIEKPSLISWFIAVAIGFFIAGVLVTAAFLNVLPLSAL